MRVDPNFIRGLTSLDESNSVLLVPVPRKATGTVSYDRNWLMGTGHLRRRRVETLNRVFHGIFTPRLDLSLRR